MASIRHIRRRLKSIHSTKQIMRAMQLVSASKLKRAQSRMLQSRQVLEFLDGLLERVLAAVAHQQPKARRKTATVAEHPLCRIREDQHRSALVVFTSDSGLCGSYNANLLHMAESYLQRDSLKRTELIYVGKRGHRYFTKRGYAAINSYLDLAGRPNLEQASLIARELMNHFLLGRLDSVHLLYSQFRSATTYRPTVLQWLPIQLNNPQSLADSGQRIAYREKQEYIFEPSAQRVFEDLLPRWALAKFQLVMLEAFTSEHSARMIAMKNATDNAEDLLKELTMQRNKIRQAAITKELSEIVGTVEALK